MAAISDSHKFIFIHIFKNAGTSVRESLSTYLNHEYDSILDHHETVTSLIPKIGIDKYESYYSFAIVRNPWDWLVSLYHFVRQSKTHYQHSLFNAMSFDEYISWRCRSPSLLLKEWPAETVFQSDFVLYNGEIKVNKIIRFESLTQDMIETCKGLRLDYPTINALNSSGRAGYQSYYNETTRQMVENAYRKDIELFNYQYD